MGIGSSAKTANTRMIRQEDIRLSSLNQRVRDQVEFLAVDADPPVVILPLPTQFRLVIRREHFVLVVEEAIPFLALECDVCNPDIRCLPGQVPHDPEVAPLAECRFVRRAPDLARGVASGWRGTARDG